MNNDQFRAYLNKGSGGGSGLATTKKKKRRIGIDHQGRGRGSTTKEIAREVVEEEFRKKRQRSGRSVGRNDDYFSSEEDDDDDDGQNKTNQRREDKEPQPQPNNDDDDDNDKVAGRGKSSTTKKKAKHHQHAPKYRDRARERREGRNVDYESTEQLVSLQPTVGGVEDGPGDADGDGSHIDPELSKFLGGDEEHTHLVRGLDLALAETMRRKAAAAATPPLPLAEDAPTNALTLASKGPSSRRRLEELRESLSSSALGRSVVEWLLGHKFPRVVHRDPKKEVSVAGRALQRSALTFSLHADVYDTTRAWESPRENAHAFSTDAGGPRTRTLTPLDEGVRQRIRSCLCGSEHGELHEDIPTKKKKKKKKKDAKPTATESRTQPSNTQTTTTTPSLLQHHPMMDDDDDIFADVGEYVPQVKVDRKNNTLSDKGHTDAKTHAGADPVTKSRFDSFSNVLSSKPDTHKPNRDRGNEPPILWKDLDLEEQPQPQQQQRKGQQPPRKHADSKRHTRKPKVIDRDVIGTRQCVQGSVVRGGLGLGGGTFVPLSSRETDYGEDMDYDFDGRIHDEEHECHTKQNHKKGTGATTTTTTTRDKYATEASKEYGAGKKLK